MEKLSCENCVHFRMCKWKGEPYMGSHSGGYPAKNYKGFRKAWYRVHGKFCLAHKGIPKAQSQYEHKG